MTWGRRLNAIFLQEEFYFRYCYSRGKSPYRGRKNDEMITKKIVWNKKETFGLITHPFHVFFVRYLPRSFVSHTAFPFPFVNPRIWSHVSHVKQWRPSKWAVTPRACGLNDNNRPLLYERSIGIS